MASVLTSTEVLAGFKALHDLVKFGSDYSTSYLKHLGAPQTHAEARRLSQVFSTNRGEIEALKRHIVDCRDRLIGREGGKDRGRCLCNIFNKIKAGKGGTLPLIDNWQRIYDELGCDSKV